MSHAQSGANRARRKKILKMAKGYRSRSKSCFRIAVQKVEKGLQYAYKHRRVKKRDFRSLWITRINAASRLNGLSYSKFIFGLKKASVEIDRKVLAEIAVSDPKGFAEIAGVAKAGI